MTMLPIEHLYRAARYQPGTIAVEADEVRLTYAELAARVDALAAHIQARVPGCQNRVAICGHNTLTHYLAILATYASGNTWVALNPQNSRRDLDRIVQVTRPGVFIVDDDCVGKFTPAQGVLLLGSEICEGGRLGGALKKRLGEVPQRQGVTLDHLQAIKFTGGSTGIPKAVLQPYRVGATHTVHMRVMYGFHRGDTGLAVQWRYDDGRALSLELNLGPRPPEVPAQHLGPVEAECVFRHRWPDGTPASTWPAWSARWTLGTEITL